MSAEVCAAPSLFDAPPVFDGDTFDPEADACRLETLLGAVHAVLQDGQWHTLADLHTQCGGSEAGVSARQRDLRKPRWNHHCIERRRATAGGGLYEYRLASPCNPHQEKDNA